MICPVILHLPGSSLCPWPAPVTIPGWISVEHNALIIWYDDVYTTSTTSTTTPSYTHITLTMARHAGGQTVTDPQHEWEDIHNVLHVVGWSVDSGHWSMNENECPPPSTSSPRQCAEFSNICLFYKNWIHGTQAGQASLIRNSPWTFLHVHWHSIHCSKTGILKSDLLSSTNW